MEGDQSNDPRTSRLFYVEPLGEPAFARCVCTPVRRTTGRYHERDVWQCARDPHAPVRCRRRLCAVFYWNNPYPSTERTHHFCRFRRTAATSREVRKRADHNCGAEGPESDILS